jgi:hypothetical protein
MSPTCRGGLRDPCTFSDMGLGVECYVESVAEAATTALGFRLVGVYLHGSMVLGGFDPRRSDVDVLVVTSDRMTAEEQSKAAYLLSEDALPCPAHGLELSIVTREVALHPSACPPFELHVTTAPEDTKVVDGHDRSGDPDLVLHFAVCRAAGRLIGSGLPPERVFGPVPRSVVLGQLAEELEWAAEHAPNEYAILNACRAWRFALEGDLVSKVEGGGWALERVRDASQRALIAAALDRQTSVSAPEVRASAAKRFARDIRTELTVASG